MPDGSIKATYTYASGYGTLGPYGGDGSWLFGTKGYLLGYSTSITENLNKAGNVPYKANLILNSPSMLGVNQIVTKPASSTVTNVATASNRALTATASEFVDISVTDGGGTGADVILSGVALAKWPTANGKLRQVKLDGDVVYDTPDLPAPSATISAAQLITDLNKRTIQKGTSDVFRLVFEHPVNKTSTNYSVVVTFTNGMTLTLLP